jgi:hypothetical protein
MSLAWWAGVEEFVLVAVFDTFVAGEGFVVVTAAESEGVVGRLAAEVLAVAVEFEGAAVAEEVDDAFVALTVVYAVAEMAVAGRWFAGAGRDVAAQETGWAVAVDTDGVELLGAAHQVGSYPIQDLSDEMDQSWFGNCHSV